MYCPGRKLGGNQHGFDFACHQDRVRGSFRAGLFNSGNVHDFCAIVLGNVRTHMGAYGGGRRVRRGGLHPQFKSGKEIQWN